MKNIAGRIHEINLLNSFFKSSKSELITVYGRRRVGKTFLIREVYRKQMYFEFSGLHNATSKDNLQNFTKNYITQLKIKEKLAIPKNWVEAFTLLEKKISVSKGKKKKVIFIDEFPWLSTKKSKFMMAFENFWNNFASNRQDLIVVICGSSASFMIQKVLRNRGGLHNRITQKIRLLPFTLKETESYLKSRNIRLGRYDIIQLYMAFGGIPHYLEKINKGESVAQIIDRLCFQKDGILRDEFEILFSSLFEHEHLHYKIVRALAKNRMGITRNNLLSASGLKSGGTFTKIIDELIESGFVSISSPFKKTVKNTLYRLSDEYSLFYLKFIEKSKSTNSGSWLRQFNSKNYQVWSGFCFETICLKHINEIKTKMGIAAVYSENSSWISSGFLNQGAQVDLVIERDDHIINLFEIKFSNSIFNIDKKYSEILKNKIATFKQETKAKKNIHFAFISTYGLVKNQYYFELIQNELTINDLF
jgi:uncharacterized protein